MHLWKVNFSKLNATEVMSTNTDPEKWHFFVWLAQFPLVILDDRPVLLLLLSFFFTWFKSAHVWQLLWDPYRVIIISECAMPKSFKYNTRLEWDARPGLDEIVFVCAERIGRRKNRDVCAKVILTIGRLLYRPSMRASYGGAV